MNADKKGKQLDEALALRIKALKAPVQLKTYISLSCEVCPEIVQMLNQMAIIHSDFSHEIIDGAYVQDEIKNLGIQGVPSVVANGKIIHSGKINLLDLLAKLESTYGVDGNHKQAQVNNLGAFDVAVIGGGPAGASAAIYSVRKGLKTAMIAERMGGQLQETKGIENFISVSYTEGPDLVGQLAKHVSDYPIHTFEHRRVVSIIGAGKAPSIGKADGATPSNRFAVGNFSKSTSGVSPGGAPSASEAANVNTPDVSPEKFISTEPDAKIINFESGEYLKANSIIVTTGAKWRNLGIPGEKEYIGRGVAFCPHCDGPYYKGKKVAVVGGGNSGVEAAIDLAGIVQEVILLEFAPDLKADDVLIRKLISLPNVSILKNVQTEEIRGDGSKVTSLLYRDRSTKRQETIDLDGVFIQIGLVPNSRFLKDIVEQTEHGEIIVDEKGRTSAKGIYAAGDVTTTPYKQIIIAMGEGAKTALAVFEDRMKLVN
ncbi:MAG: FAD-dependent oxidoreductase [Flavobacteriales bacterium]|nr:FAD-dependent oxidoreductase [Flavobacteriales bacterium]